MIKFFKLQCYEDLNFFKKLIFKFRLARQLKKAIKFSNYCETHERIDFDFNSYIKEHF